MDPLRVAWLAAFAAVSISQFPIRPDLVVVKSVVNGHTIDTSRGRVRLRGIEAPSPGRGLDVGAPFGREAKNRLEGIVARRFVRLEFAAGRGNRSAAYVVLEDGTFVNAVLVREGLARVTQPSGARAAELQRAEAEARAMNRGIWR